MRKRTTSRAREKKGFRIESVLIANRGEIARRIIKSCKARGIEAVAVYVPEERESAFVAEADRALPFPQGRSKESSGAAPYLAIPQILAVAAKAKVNALHPGYGFLSESPALAKAVRDQGIEFIGPSAEAMALLGNKIEAKQLAQSIGIPRAPSMLWRGGDLAAATAWAARVKLPLLIKAAAGGGGRGMREVREIDELPHLVQRASEEARRLFGQGTIYLEKKIVGARHIEVQIVGDKLGNCISLLDRDCTFQRNHQKVVEEAPAPRLSPRLREEMHECSVSLAKKAGYHGLGTVEFLVDTHGHFYFLEVNCRLQVEHPVTEAVTGIDLVGLQFDIAEGKTLPTIFPTQPISQGAAIEVRLCAESPAEGFRPSIGTITTLAWPESDGLRVDSGFRAGDTVTPFFDSLLAKLIVHGKNRDEARNRLEKILEHTSIAGVDTNLNFLKALVSSSIFRDLQHTITSASEQTFLQAAAASPSRASSRAHGDSMLTNDPWDIADNFGRRFARNAALPKTAQEANTKTAVVRGATTITSPLPGKIVTISCQKGARCQEGQTLVTLESMKMEHPIRAVHNGKILGVHIKAGQQVQAKAVLLDVEYD